MKGAIEKSFSMKDMGAAKQILGIRIIRDRKEKAVTRTLH